MSFKSGLIILLAGISSASFAGDVEKGRELHQENCISCHQAKMGGDGSAIYTREDRRIESFAALDKQVRRCKTSLGVPWPEHQIDDVITYLNETFYKFDVQ
ncbi:MAG: cytochrome c [Thioalkalispiraceae bacterium]|jgi:mono/diheme cytochrome c family protein